MWATLAKICLDRDSLPLSIGGLEHPGSAFGTMGENVPFVCHLRVVFFYRAYSKVTLGPPTPKANELHQVEPHETVAQSSDTADLAASKQDCGQRFSHGRFHIRHRRILKLASTALVGP